MEHFHIQPTDVGHIAEYRAKVAPDSVILSPYMGHDSIEPFIRHGRKVTIIGCCPLTHPQACKEIQLIISEWTFFNKLERVIGCDEMQSILHRH